VYALLLLSFLFKVWPDAPLFDLFRLDFSAIARPSDPFWSAGVSFSLFFSFDFPGGVFSIPLFDTVPAPDCHVADVTLRSSPALFPFSGIGWTGRFFFSCCSDDGSFVFVEDNVFHFLFFVLPLFSFFTCTELLRLVTFQHFFSLWRVSSGSFRGSYFAPTKLSLLE